MPKALSAIVAVVLLLMMTVGAAGLAYVFISGLQKSGEESTQGQLSTMQEAISSCMAIDSVYSNKVYLRNCGDGIIASDSLKFYIDNAPIASSMSPARIKKGEVGEVIFYPKSCKELQQYSGRHTLKISSDVTSTSQTKNYGIYESGVYIIDPDGTASIQPIQAYCDMTTDGGGWTRCMAIVAGDTSTCNTDRRWQNCTSMGGDVAGEIMSKWFNVGRLSTDGAIPVSVVKFNTGPDAPYNTLKGMFSFPRTAGDGWQFDNSQVFNLQVLSGTPYTNRIWWDWGGTLQRKANYCIGASPTHQACVYQGTDHGQCGNIFHDGVWSSSGTAQELYIRSK